MVDEYRQWREANLRKFQIVQCVVTGHREHFGVEVSLTSPPSGLRAFIDFVMLAEAGMRVTPSDFPPVGSVIEAVAIDFMPWGELRLSARQSSISRQRELE
ncbi:hypothetical protein EDC02_4593 [Micromonospora sp. Llam0]|uniref:hypothetical protein n=1 Tax=Micromonospora sp. Llam0 TaxID=2485143 RepID=UPI000FB3316F|nr:hypothetical protein [Micromonospora sp. Llam0]ROO62612.1 hypothetical protein EDC02_4593 [Micromonospora sp. Llam0]